MTYAILPIALFLCGLLYIQYGRAAKKNNPQVTSSEPSQNVVEGQSHTATQKLRHRPLYQKMAPVRTEGFDNAHLLIWRIQELMESQFPSVTLNGPTVTAEQKDYNAFWFTANGSGQMKQDATKTPPWWFVAIFICFVGTCWGLGEEEDWVFLPIMAGVALVWVWFRYFNQTARVTGMQLTIMGRGTYHPGNTEEGHNPRVHNAVLHMELYMGGTIHSNLMMRDPRNHPDFPELQGRFDVIRDQLQLQSFWHARVQADSAVGNLAKVTATS